VVKHSREPNDPFLLSEEEKKFTFALNDYNSQNIIRHVHLNSNRRYSEMNLFTTLCTRVAKHSHPFVGCGSLGPKISLGPRLTFARFRAFLKNNCENRSRFLDYDFIFNFKIDLFKFEWFIGEIKGENCRPSPNEHP
jgi:hypothetical protein